MQERAGKELKCRKELGKSYSAGRSWGRAKVQEGAGKEPKCRKELGKS